jgi:hypothetical protein
MRVSDKRWQARWHAVQLNDRIIRFLGITVVLLYTDMTADRSRPTIVGSFNFFFPCRVPSPWQHRRPRS